MILVFNYYSFPLLVKPRMSVLLVYIQTICFDLNNKKEEIFISHILCLQFTLLFITVLFCSSLFYFVIILMQFKHVDRHRISRHLGTIWSRPVYLPQAREMSFLEESWHDCYTSSSSFTAQSASGAAAKFRDWNTWKSRHFFVISST